MMKGQKGITLVALVITIIVMLILVGVSITVAMQGGLFDTARNAATGTNEAAAAENKLSEGKVVYKATDGNLYEGSLEDAANGTVGSEPVNTAPTE